MRISRLALLVIAGVAAALVIAAAGAGQARAATGITGFKVTPSETQAGGHPDVLIEIEWKNRVVEPFDPCGCDDARTIRTSMPTGFIGNPHVVPKCTFTEFSIGECPPEAQVGTLMTELGFTPVYSMETRPDEAGLLGFIIPLTGAPSFISLSARTDSDYGLESTSSPIIHLLPIPQFIKLTLWGVPADPVHDIHRFVTPLEGVGSCGFPETGCPPQTGIGSNVPPRPYLQNPTTCATPLVAKTRIDYYNGDVHTAEAPWPATTGCDLLSFDPSLTVKPTTTQADTATGVDVDLVIPQTQSKETPSPSQIRTSRVTMPEGFSINPNAANGKTACTDAEGAFGTRDAADCPEHSKIGTVQIDSTALPGPIDGGIFLGESRPGDKYRIFLTADGFATHVKLAGSVRPDPVTGRVTVEFVDLPQSPLSRFNMHFFGSERGIMATPTQCGRYAVESEFVPWNNVLPKQTSTSFFTIDSGPNGKPCPPPVRPFEPGLEAGTVNNTAGDYAPLGLHLTRDDGEQNLSALNVAMPPGFSGRLAGIPYCPEAAIAAAGDPLRSGVLERAQPACPAASRIGTAVTGVGASSQPLHTPGDVYLAGPYKGAPLSLLVVIPAVSGPYDLGNVVVRTAIHVDPITARISALSDPFPQILEGIPLRVRSVAIDLDRPGFTLNPTNCSRFAIAAEVFGNQGGVARPAYHFQVANCANLRFKPRLALRLDGNKKRRGHPALRAVLRPRPGEANIGRTTVTLPAATILDNANIKAPCTRAQYAASACPPESVVGHASARTSLLDEPLSGPVYLRSGSNKLPDLVADLRGQVSFTLLGRIDAVRGRLRTNFASVPDVPVDSFVLRMKGGSRGLLVNTEHVCRNPQRATVVQVGQNGRRTKATPKLQGCGGKRAAMRAGAGRGGAR